jgi:hypothetical protein
MILCRDSNQRKWAIAVYAIGAALVLLQAFNRVGTLRPLYAEVTFEAAKPQIWEAPRIVVLAGPHKTGSTSLQNFICNIGGTTYVTGNHAHNNASEHFITPHAANTKWSWPVGLYDEYCLEKNLICAGEQRNPYQFSPKFYSALVPLITEWGMDKTWPGWIDNTTDVVDYAHNDAVKANIADYFRNLFRIPWEEGKNIVIGSEVFDKLTKELTGIRRERGETTHVAPRASDRIRTLLDLFPWKSTPQSQQTPLRLEDIEVQINLRSPRFSHLASLWHESSSSIAAFQGLTLREFIVYAPHRTFNNVDSLGLALQFVRMGVHTTIVDMLGIAEKDKREASMEKTTTGENFTVIGGMQGILACDILRVGTKKISSSSSSMWCDPSSRLHLPDFEQEDGGVYNHREDPASRDLTDEQVEEMERAITEYDCSIWKYLRKYEEKGTLRILYKSKDLFATCDSERSKDISVFRLTNKLEEIARRDNGIPFGEITNPKFYYWLEKDTTEWLGKDGNPENSTLSGDAIVGVLLVAGVALYMVYKKEFPRSLFQRTGKKQ